MKIILSARISRRFFIIFIVTFSIVMLLLVCAYNCDIVSEDFYSPSIVGIDITSTSKRSQLSDEAVLLSGYSTTFVTKIAIEAGKGSIIVTGRIYRFSQRIHLFGCNTGIRLSYMRDFKAYPTYTQDTVLRVDNTAMLPFEFASVTNFYPDLLIVVTGIGYGTTNSLTSIQRLPRFRYWRQLLLPLDDN